MTPPKPGSYEARKMGCKCPTHQNHHGRGRHGDGERHGWLVNSTCGVHGIPALDALLKAVGATGGGT